MSAGEFLPTANIRECTWQLVERQTAQYARGGASQVIDLGRPYWRISVTYENLPPSVFRDLTAWLSRRRGARVTFAARRPGRKPSFTQDPVGTLLELLEDGRLRVTTGAGNPKPVVGDLISYTTTTGARYIGELVSITVSGVTLISGTMHPPALAPSTSAPDIAIVGAWGLFRLEADSVQISEVYDNSKRVSFTARQVEI